MVLNQDGGLSGLVDNEVEVGRPAKEGQREAAGGRRGRGAAIATHVKSLIPTQEKNKTKKKTKKKTDKQKTNKQTKINKPPKKQKKPKQKKQTNKQTNKKHQNPPWAKQKYTIIKINKNK